LKYLEQPPRWGDSQLSINKNKYLSKAPQHQGGKRLIVNRCISKEVNIVMNNIHAMNKFCNLEM
jgi:hypothetical protein